MKNILKLSLGIIAIIAFISCEKDDQISIQEELQSELRTINTIDQGTATQGLVAQGNDKITLVLDNGQTVVIDGPTNYIVPAGTIVTAMIIDVDVVMMASCTFQSAVVSYSFATGNWGVSVTVNGPNGTETGTSFSGSLNYAAAGAIGMALTLAGC